MSEPLKNEHTFRLCPSPLDQLLALADLMNKGGEIDKRALEAFQMIIQNGIGGLKERAATVQQRCKVNCLPPTLARVVSLILDTEELATIPITVAYYGDDVNMLESRRVPFLKPNEWTLLVQELTECTPEDLIRDAKRVPSNLAMQGQKNHRFFPTSIEGVELILKDLDNGHGTFSLEHGFYDARIGLDHPSVMACLSSLVFLTSSI